MTPSNKPITWSGTDKLRVYLSGKLVDELQGHEVANLLVECAKVLRREETPRG